MRIATAAERQKTATLWAALLQSSVFSHPRLCRQGWTHGKGLLTTLAALKSHSRDTATAECEGGPLFAFGMSVLQLCSSNLQDWPDFCLRAISITQLAAGSTLLKHLQRIAWDAARAAAPSTAATASGSNGQAPTASYGIGNLPADTAALRFTASVKAPVNWQSNRPAGTAVAPAPDGSGNLPIHSAALGFAATTPAAAHLSRRAAGTAAAHLRWGSDTAAGKAAPAADIMGTGNAAKCLPNSAGLFNYSGKVARAATEALANHGSLLQHSARVEQLPSSLGISAIVRGSRLGMAQLAVQQVAAEDDSQVLEVLGSDGSTTSSCSNSFSSGSHQSASSNSGSSSSDDPSYCSNYVPPRPSPEDHQYAATLLESLATTPLEHLAFAAKHCS